MWYVTVLCVCLSIYLSVCLSFYVFLSAYLPVCLLLNKNYNRLPLRPAITNRYCTYVPVWVFIYITTYLTLSVFSHNTYTYMLLTLEVRRTDTCCGACVCVCNCLWVCENMCASVYSSNTYSFSIYMSCCSLMQQPKCLCVYVCVSVYVSIITY